MRHIKIPPRITHVRITFGPPPEAPTSGITPRNQGRPTCSTPPLPRKRRTTWSKRDLSAQPFRWLSVHVHWLTMAVLILPLKTWDLMKVLRDSFLNRTGDCPLAADASNPVEHMALSREEGGRWVGFSMHGMASTGTKSAPTSDRGIAERGPSSSTGLKTKNHSVPPTVPSGSLPPIGGKFIDEDQPACHLAETVRFQSSKTYALPLGSPEDRMRQSPIFNEWPPKRENAQHPAHGFRPRGDRNQDDPKYLTVRRMDQVSHLRSTTQTNFDTFCYLRRGDAKKHKKENTYAHC